VSASFSHITSGVKGCCWDTQHGVETVAKGVGD